jgi:membrane associated rhomboid family serine protease
MTSGPDLFVVCKNCQAEVSPYITECPYCGTRLRKRAPKLDKGGVPKEARRRRRPKASLPRFKPGEIPGVRVDYARPYATFLLVLAAVLVTFGWRADVVSVADLVLVGPIGDEHWRAVTTLFVYDQTGYQIAALAAIFLFGWLLERRHGLWVPLLVFLLGGGAGSELANATDSEPIVLGGNGGALALLAAWSVRDLLGRRRGEEDDSDMLAVLFIAAVLVLLPLAVTDAHPMAGLGGGVVGLILGLGLARLRER